MGVKTLIERAERDEHYEGTTLVVFDALDSERTTGVRAEVTPDVDRTGFSAYVHDGIGNGSSAHAPGQVEALTLALDGYLDIINRRR